MDLKKRKEKFEDDCVDLPYDIYMLGYLNLFIRIFRFHEMHVLAAQQAYSTEADAVQTVQNELSPADNCILTYIFSALKLNVHVTLCVNCTYCLIL